ncbi:AraC family transcriptional regulator [Paenarthrobacter sp. JL.01a]|uniref:AraC family transcriptional regulator n=1 Tax=Paenarthrobacter sp. JL.01a TaxID=2979324 RepID=UPI0021C7289B|nr:helix-turn-helix domain-containing protein [Paenarthrobacter sp. JL.01a]UXM91825.1 helix-turn-helix domain-containing protein [Paenarthrobacter sp. JL.01a]
MAIPSSRGGDCAVTAIQDDGAGRLTQYNVPHDLTAEQKFDHWRDWYGSAVETPMRLERRGGQPGPSFSPTATSFGVPDVSLIEVRNEPAAGFWGGNPSSHDVRLVYFRRAPSVTLCAPDPLPVQSGYVGFLDVARNGGFDAPAGLHAFQVNINRSRLDLDERSYARLLQHQDLSRHPLVKGFVVPSLMNWKQPGLASEAEGVADIFTSVVTALVSSLLQAPADGSLLEPGRRLAIRQYVKANFRNRDLDPDGIAVHFRISRRTLFHHFENESMSLFSYVRLLRTVMALQLLTDPGSRKIPLSDIANASGFSGLQSMRRALKETTGLTIREARQHESLARTSIVKLRESLSP